MSNKNLSQNTKGSLRNPTRSLDTRGNRMTENATNLEYSPMHLIGNRVSDLGSTFNKTAHARLRFGKNNKFDSIDTFNRLNNAKSGILNPKIVETTFLNVKPNGKYINTNRIVKLDKYGPHFKFGNTKIYF